MIAGAFELFIILVSMVKPLIEEAELAYPDAKQGKIKEEYVIQALKVILFGVGWFAKGTVPYQNMVLNIARQAIPTVVGVLNTTGAWGKDIDLSNIPPEGVVIK